MEVFFKELAKYREEQYWFVDVDLGIGTTLADFHSLGKWLLVIDKLKRLVSERAILSEVALSMCAEIPSGPLAFNTSKPLRSCLISCVVRSK